MNLIEYLQKHMAWSAATFGPGRRTQGITEHIREELSEIEQEPLDLFEWVDVVILALDGAWRAGYTPETICAALVSKQKINFQRKWHENPVEDQPTSRDRSEP
jgi:hypothetical protein